MLGDFDIAADRLMFVDGEVDPWRPDTPHSDDAKPRDDTILRPFKLIPGTSKTLEIHLEIRSTCSNEFYLDDKGAVHHWDENGLADVTQEPVVIQDIHAEEVAIIEQWLADWKPPTKKD